MIAGYKRSKKEAERRKEKRFAKVKREVEREQKLYLEKHPIEREEQNEEAGNIL